MKNVLPQYWVVKRDETNPNWKKVISYLNEQSGYEWNGDGFNYYGTEANDKEGVNCYDTFSYFKGNPTLLTIEEFMKLTNQNTMVDFKVKGTKLPVITHGTYFRCVDWDQMDSCHWSGEANNLISFGTQTFNNETYILAEKANYIGSNYYMFLESTLQELAKKQNLTEQKSETMVTIKREQLQEIHDIACSTWKDRIKDIAKDQPFGDIELSQVEVDEMFKAATNDQLPVLEKIFGKQEEEINLGEILECILECIEIREDSNLKHKSFFLPTKYTYEIIKDWDGVDCLVPTIIK
jgi:hypothetical protein